MLQLANEMEDDIPDSVQAALSSGKFQNYMEEYRVDRLIHRHNKTPGKVFLDIGDYNEGLPLKLKIEMYQCLKEYELEVQRLKTKK